MKKILATDLDGTLLFPRKFFRFVPYRNRKFLRKYIDNGGRVVLISSRNVAFCQRVINKIKRPIDCIAQNSAVILHDGEVIRNQCFDLDLANEIIRIFHEEYQSKNCAIYIVNEEDGLLVNPKKANFINRFGIFLWSYSYLWNREKIQFRSKIYQNVQKNGIIYKLVISNGISKKSRRQGYDIAMALQERFPEIEVAFSDYITEITPKDCNKAKGLLFYMNALGLTKEDFAVVGDSGNDIPMFEEFPLSFAMKHGYEYVREKAKYEIKRVRDLENYLSILEGEKNGQEE